MGDSRGVLCKGQTHQAIPLSEDQKVSCAHERARAESKGAVILNGRVNGQLAVTRAFGDLSLRDVGAIDAVPAVTRAYAAAGDRVVLCSDGVFDKLSNEMVVATVRATQTATAAATALVDAALGNQTEDNVTAVAIFL